MVVVPRTRFWGAALLAAVMLGAMVVHVAILHESLAKPLALLVFAGAVLWGRLSDVVHTRSVRPRA
jgi:hypothetical protein